MSEVEVFDALRYRVEVDERGTRWYYNSAGQLHREGGPAIEHTNGAKFWYWYQNGLRHRTDGPAVEYADGTKNWCRYGLWHRTDGPAIECTNGYKRWFIHGVEMTEAEFNQLVMKMPEIAVFDTLKYRIEVEQYGTRLQ